MPQSSFAYETIGSRAFARPSSVDFRRTKALAFIFVSLDTRRSKDDLWQVDGGVLSFSFLSLPLSAVTAIAAAAPATNKSVLGARG